jgi:Tfp pilus assembly protein PilV
MKGFTLVELLVASVVFITIVLAVTSPLTSLLKYQRASQSSNHLRDNLQFIVNVMDKEFRTSRNPNINPVGPNSLAITNQEGQVITYSFNEDDGFTRNGVLLADDEIMTIRTVRFILRGGSGADPERLTVIIGAQTTDGSDTTAIQNTTLLRNN